MALNKIILIGVGLVGLYLAWPTIQGWLNKKKSGDIVQQYGDATGATPNLGGALITGTGFGLAEASPEEIAAAQGPAPKPAKAATRSKGSVSSTRNKFPPIRPASGSSKFPPIRPSNRPRGNGGTCSFPNPTTVCWNGANGTNSCSGFNAKSSDASSVSGRQTLCARAQSKYLAQHISHKSLSYVGQRIGVA
jgi:hypothetical protein